MPRLVGRNMFLVSAAVMRCNDGQRFQHQACRIVVRKLKQAAAEKIPDQHRNNTTMSQERCHRAYNIRGAARRYKQVLFARRVSTEVAGIQGSQFGV